MHTVTHFLFHGSPLLIYCLVVVILLLESSAIPITNNTLLLVTGALASLGHLNIWFLFVSALVGSVAGACLAYAIGLRGGPAFLVRLAKIFHISPQKMAISERWYRKMGARMVFISRMTPHVRPFACFPAGVMQMSFPRFFIAAFAGSTIWCAAFLSLGWFLGNRYTIALQLMRRYSLLSVIVVVALIIVYLLVVRLLKRSAHRHLHLDNNEPNDESESSVSPLLTV